jgi:hypothetical protein
MNRRGLTLVMIAIAASLLLSKPIGAQLVPPAKKAAHVAITQGPEVESAKNNEVIIRWTSNNPGGSDEHFGVVYYGKTPDDLSQTAKSHIRLNQGHSFTVFRVRVEGVERHTMYYYKVDSVDARGTSDGVNSTVNTFATP